MLCYADGEDDHGVAVTLFREYAAGLGVDLCFQGFERELSNLAEVYGPPRGALLLARVGGAPAGCAAIRPIAEDVCELKRMYVRPPYRGQAIGQRMLDELISAARGMGYRKMRLDTLSHLNAALSLYRRNGFAECGPYYRNPTPGVVYMDRDILVR
ncbi:MAG: GNAT family N-acetyltransferase [Chitinophagia bacterium]|nr:GNAT family N-acetyltransferase [Chitinophagia bacterium]